MHQLLNGDQKFLTIDEVLKDEYLHFHGLLSVFRSIGHGTVPYAYIPPVEVVPETREGSGVPIAPLQTSPSPSSTQDDELANLAEKHREGYIALEETTSIEKSKSSQESPLHASEGMFLVLMRKYFRVWGISPYLRLYTLQRISGRIL